LFEGFGVHILQTIEIKSIRYRIGMLKICVSSLIKKRGIVKTCKDTLIILEIRVSITRGFLLYFFRYPLDYFFWE